MLKALLKRSKPREDYTFRFIVGKLDSMGKLETHPESASITTETGQILLFINQDQLRSFKIKEQVNSEHVERGRKKGLDDFSIMGNMPYPHLNTQIFAVANMTPEQIKNIIENYREEIMESIGVLPAKPVFIPCAQRKNDFIAVLEVNFT